MTTTEVQLSTEPKTADGQRPEGLPDKFKSVGDMVAAYAELEKKLGSSAPASAANPTGLPQMEPVKPADAQKAVQESGIDMDKLAAEVLEKGALSEESTKALAAKGLAPSVVNVYVEGQKALVKQVNDALSSAAGGAEELSKMVAWGAANYSPEELAAFNEAVKASPALGRLAVEGLKARFTAAVGQPGQFIEGQPAGVAGGVQPFKSAYEMSQAMNDPRYKKDPGFRADVAARVKASPRFF